MFVAAKTQVTPTVVLCILNRKTPTHTHDGREGNRTSYIRFARWTPSHALGNRFDVRGCDGLRCYGIWCEIMLFVPDWISKTGERIS